MAGSGSLISTWESAEQVPTELSAGFGSAMGIPREAFLGPKIPALYSDKAGAPFLFGQCQLPVDAESSCHYLRAGVGLPTAHGEGI